MENLLFVLALLGIVLGAYSLFLPTLRKRGWSLPLMRLVDDADDDDIGVADDLDEPLDLAFAEKKAKKQKEPKAKKAKGGDKGSPVPERFVVTPGAEMKPLPSKGSPSRPAEPILEEEIEPGIIIEHPNALKNLDEELELDPELQALVDAVAEDEAVVDAPAPVAVAAPPVPVAVAAAAEEPVAEAAPVKAVKAEAPPAQKPADDLNGDILSLFEETEVKDTRPPALREALKLCTMDELRDEAEAMRTILAAFNSGQHAA